MVVYLLLGYLVFRAQDASARSGRSLIWNDAFIALAQEQVMGGVPTRTDGHTCPWTVAALGSLASVALSSATALLAYRASLRGSNTSWSTILATEPS